MANIGKERFCQEPRSIFSPCRGRREKEGVLGESNFYCSRVCNSAIEIFLTLTWAINVMTSVRS